MPHCEHQDLPRSPAYVLFACVTPATTGGATPIYDMDLVRRRLAETDTGVRLIEVSARPTPPVRGARPWCPRALVQSRAKQTVVLVVSSVCCTAPRRLWRLRRPPPPHTHTHTTTTTTTITRSNVSTTATMPPPPLCHRRHCRRHAPCHDTCTRGRIFERRGCWSHDFTPLTTIRAQHRCRKSIIHRRLTSSPS